MDLSKVNVKYFFNKHLYFDSKNSKNIVFDYLHKINPNLFVDSDREYTFADIYGSIIAEMLRHEMCLGKNEGPFFRLDHNLSVLFKRKFINLAQLVEFVDFHLRLACSREFKILRSEIINLMSAFFPKPICYDACKDFGHRLTSNIKNEFVKVPTEFLKVFQEQNFKWKNYLKVYPLCYRIEKCAIFLRDSQNSLVICLENTPFRDFLGFTACICTDLPFLVVAVLVRKALEPPSEENREIFFQRGANFLSSRYDSDDYDS